MQTTTPPPISKKDDGAGAGGGDGGGGMTSATSTTSPRAADANGGGDGAGGGDDGGLVSKEEEEQQEDSKNTSPTATSSSEKKKAHHKNKVSWGGVDTPHNNNTATAASSSSPKSPPPEDTDGLSSEAAAAAAAAEAAAGLLGKDSSSSSSSWSGAAGTAAGRFSSLREKVNPYELEAETLLITSLEAMEAREHKNNKTSSSKPDILEFVPHGHEGIFTSAENHGHHHHAQQPSALTTGATTMTGTQTEQASSWPSAEQRRAQLGRHQQHTYANAVQEDLFCLTHALDAIQRTDYNRPVVVGDATTTVTTATGADVVPVDPFQQQQPPQQQEVNPHHAVGSADLLAANAAILFRRRGDSQKVHMDGDGHIVMDTLQEEEERKSLLASQTRWNKFQAAIGGSPKKQRHNNDMEHHHGVTSGSLLAADAAGVESISIDMPGRSAAAAQPPPQSQGVGGTTSKFNKSNNKKKRPMLTFLAAQPVVLRNFVNQQRQASLTSLLLMIPLIGIAFILFYVLGNPPTGVVTIVRDANGTIISQDPVIIDPNQPSHSWYLLFATRQLVTFALARATEVLVIDIFCLRFRWINVFKSPLLTLLFVQSRGWPFRISAWAIYDLLLLHGEGKFVQHWMFYQDFLRIFNESNPSGNATNGTFYTQVIFLLLAIGLATSCKRVAVGYMQGKRVFATYGEEVAIVMRKVLLISQVGILARNISAQHTTTNTDDETRLREDDIWEKVEQFVQSRTSEGSTAAGGLLDDPVLGGRDGMTGSISEAQQMKIIELLGDWEDPELESGMFEAEDNISVTSILQFRQSLTFLNCRDMFGHCYGPTDTREHCIESSEEVYGRLLLRSNKEGTLSFHVLAMLALNSDGTLKQDKIKELIRLFRPERDGTLSALDFVRSVDTVYKRMKLLRASIKKTQRLDQAVERIFNIGFFLVVGAIALAVVGIDPLALFLSLSSIIISFAFMIGSASAKYFEGLLFIIVRKPYGVGDRVFFNAPDDEQDMHGSPGWFVRDITLYHTTLVFGTTNECCTVSNGSLSDLRVINAQRSPKGVLYVFLKFPTDVSWAKIQVFEQALRAFVKARPREWLNFLGFRTTTVETDLGFHEVLVVLQHRESWQNVVPMLVSRAQLTTFCHELQKKMNMRYKSPPLPVHLTMNNLSSSSCSDLFGSSAAAQADAQAAVVARYAGASGAVPTAGGRSAASGGGDSSSGAAAAGSRTDLDSVARLFGKQSDVVDKTAASF